MTKEPAVIIGVIISILTAIIAFTTELNDLLAAVTPILQAFATRQNVYAPATVDAIIGRKKALGGE